MKKNHDQQSKEAFDFRYSESLKNDNRKADLIRENFYLDELSIEEQMLKIDQVKQFFENEIEKELDDIETKEYLYLDDSDFYNLLRSQMLFYGIIEKTF